jgi:hypothetical protein
MQTVVCLWSPGSYWGFFSFVLFTIFFFLFRRTPCTIWHKGELYLNCKKSSVQGFLLANKFRYGQEYILDEP